MIGAGIGLMIGALLNGTGGLVMKYKRLTTENPSGNMENILNMTKIIDKEVYLRDLNGEDDVSLVGYCKREYKKICGVEIDASAEDFGDYMDDDSLLSLFYWMAVGYAELRARLSLYEDSNLSPNQTKHSKDALELAKKALTSWSNDNCQPPTTCEKCEFEQLVLCDNASALEAIEKVIGGEQT